MPVPSAPYSEATLRAYLLDEVLGSDVAGEFEWTDASQPVQTAVDETLLSLNVSDFSGFTTGAQLRKVRAYGRREIWRQAMHHSANRITAGADGASSSDQQLHEHCKAQYKLAAQEVATEYGGNVDDDGGSSVYDMPAAVVRSQSYEDSYSEWSED